MEYILNDNNLNIIIESDISTINASKVEKDISDIIEGKAFTNLILDFKNVNYISSVGLRVLLKFKKTLKENLAIINVSNEVFNIFSMTGFDSMLNIKKALRSIDITGCEIIGQGGNGTIYRLDDDKIVKVYRPSVSLEKIDKEREFAKTALVNGLPCVIAYDVVTCGESYGIVFELLKSDTLGHAMRDNPDKLEEYIQKYVALAKDLHSTKVKEGSFVNIKTMLHKRVKFLSRWCTEEELKLLDSLIDEMPEGDTLIHGDLHPGNIMIQDGELLLIDMPEVTMGAKIWDIAGIYRDMIVAPKTAPESIIYSIGMPADLIIKVGYRFFELYTGITDKEQLEKYFKQLGLLYALNVVLILGTGSKHAVERADVIVNKLLREVVIPNEQAIRYILKSDI